MAAGKNIYRVLVASGVDRIYDFIKETLPRDNYELLPLCDNAASLRRLLLERNVDLIVINAPLPDEFGVQLALDLSEEGYGILILSPAEAYEQVCYRVEDYGIMTLAKPAPRKSFYAAIRLLTAMRAGFQRMNRKIIALQEKMTDIRTVNRAKWILIEKEHLTEEEAHYSIEKMAMDMRLSRKDAAEEIIRKYVN